MRGRDLFSIMRPVLVGGAGLLRVIPAVVVRGMWQWLDVFPGRLGVGMRYMFARRLAHQIGDNVMFGRQIEIIGWENLSLGRNVSIHKSCYLDATGGLQIGNDVSIAHQSSVLTFEHTWDNVDIPIRSNPHILKPVHIADDVWVGCGVRVLGGVNIGRRVIVAAGAVVTRDVPDARIVGGVPAREIKRL